MYLYLVRHAIAVPHDAPDVPDDASRPLTDEGVKKMQGCVRGLRRLKLELDEIWTSPLVRAQATAEILAKGFPDAKTRVEKLLAPGGDVAALIKRLQSRQNLRGIALVGHEPDMGEFCMQVVAGRRGPGFLFKKGGVACVEIDDLNPPVRGELCWLLTPAQLRSIR